MSVDRCLELTRRMGVPSAEARRLCEDTDLQRCAAGLLPRKGEDQDTILDNLMHY